MEISETLKSDIRQIQSGITKAIQNHQACILKMRDDPGLEGDIKSELSKIQKHIIELNDKQKVLLQQLRKELEEHITNGQLPVYNFNLYKVKPGQLESKKRRRKDLSLAPKTIACRPTQSPLSLSPSPTPSLSSSMSDDSDDYDVSPFMLPVPVPRPRPKLLPDAKENAYLCSVSRRDLRQPKVKKIPKALSDEEVFKDIPVYDDPIPSPPPTDEREVKARYMKALQLITKEELFEFQNRKVERKRRSTATNNPNFVYNNDWEIPVWKRSKTYLSPHKLTKVETTTTTSTTTKKGKSDDGSDGSTSKNVKKDKEPEQDKPGRLCLDDVKLPPGLVVEKIDGKSRNSTPDSSTSTSMLCFVCRTSGLLSICKDCTACYHLSCASPGPNITCPNCKNKPSPAEGASGEESGKEEFASKCPNVAESYYKLKEYIESHTESDTAALIAERENVKMELLIKNQELYKEKTKLEERAAELSEALLVQEDSRSELLKEEQSLLSKIKVIENFVTLYQKTTKKIIPEPAELKTAKQDPCSESTTEKNSQASEKTCDDMIGTCENSILSSNSQNCENSYLFSQESGENSCRNTPSPPSKKSLAIIPENGESCSSLAKEGMTISLNDGNDDSCASLSKERTVNSNDENGNSRGSSIRDMTAPIDDENCDSRASITRENVNSQDLEEDWYSPGTALSIESGTNQGGLIENCNSPAPSSKDSVTNHDGLPYNCDSPTSSKESDPNLEGGLPYNYGSPAPSSKESMTNPLFELEDGDDQFTSQSIEQNSFDSEGINDEA